jgi:monoamine oxidase
MAIPFSMLRLPSVDISEAGFKPLKLTAIRELGIGANAKLQLQFTNRYWRSLGCNGDTYADTGYQNTWEVTRAQPGVSGILVNYTGGDVARQAASITPEKALSRIEPVVPGLTALWNKKSHLQDWPSYEFTRGSYSYWKRGQYTLSPVWRRKWRAHAIFAGNTRP